MSYQFTAGRFKGWAGDGVTPLAGGRLYTLASGTTTHKATYTDATLATPCAYTSDGAGGLYIALDARGEAQLWLGSGAYTFTLKTSAGASVWTVDGVSDPAGVADALRADLGSTAAGKGASLIGTDDGSDAQASLDAINAKLSDIQGGHADGSGAVRYALRIGSTANVTGLVSMAVGISGDYQPSPPSGPYGFHALEDRCTINMTGFTNAYASYSVTPTIAGSSNYDHFKAIQAWPSYTSSGNMNDFDVIDTYPNHSGSGTITNLRHFRVKGNLGSGPITNEYGLYIDGINRGSSSNFAIYSISGAKSFHYGAFGIGPGTSGVTAGLTVGGGQIRTIGAAGYFEAASSLSRFGPADQFIGVGGSTDTGISTFNDLHFAVSSTSMVKMTAAGHLMPTADNTKNLGGASNRWGTVYAGTGTINTSDARSKQQVRSLTTAERAVALRIKGLVKAFKFNDAVTAKGAGARIHFGVIAQDVKAAFEAEGLVAESYGLLCYDEWPDQYEPIHEPRVETDEHGNEFTTMVKVGQRLATPAGNRYGVRYEELMIFVLAAI